MLLELYNVPLSQATAAHKSIIDIPTICPIASTDMHDLVINKPKDFIHSDTKHDKSMTSNNCLQVP